MHLHDLENPITATEWTTITDPDDIEYYLQIRNRIHFGQAQGTPITEPPYSTLLNWEATTTTATNILDGKHTETQSTSHQCQHLLNQCKKTTDKALIPPHITLKNFKGKLKVWRENTTTSPSGRHLGHYKSLLARGPYDNTQELYHQLHKEQDYITNAIISILNYCIQTNYTLRRWLTIVNTMIFKEPGNYKIHRLRVIHIYEADFNLLLAVKWRQLLHANESKNLINKGLYGSRPGRDAQTLTFLEELKYDISYTTRRTLFNFDNDATSCYDRILIPLASIINKKYGMPSEVVHLHANTLQRAKFHIRNPLGYSLSYYSHQSDQPIHGSGQGSGNSPCIWLLISSTLCDAHQQISKGAKFVSVDGQHSAHITMVGFVDDCTGTCNDFQPQLQATTDNITNTMAKDAQTWNDILWCSGGKLELPKCSFHVLEFQFSPDGTPTPIINNNTHQITLNDSATNAQVQINPNKANIPHKTLGHWKAPADPKQTLQLQTLLTKAKHTTLLIATANLTRHGTNLAYHGVYIAFLRYVLPQCFFTAKQLNSAEQQTIQPIISKCGYNRNTATAIRYAPTSYAGCGFVRWTRLQGEGQIALFLKHW